MPKIVFAALQRFLQDRSGRLAPVPVHSRRTHRREEETGVSPLLLAGLIAGVYVALRIGLTYALLGH